jgi:plastocyanin
MRPTHPIGLLALLALLAAADTPKTGGSVTGTVITVENGAKKARSDVYVFLEDVKKSRRNRTLPGAGQKKQIRQVKTEFVPNVLVVPVGTEITFPNFDSFEHNVYSPTDPGFDLGKYGPDKTGKSHVFEDADEFDIYCDVHRSMWAKVKVVDSPYIQPVKSGAFSFSNVPPGTYRVVAWVQNSVEVKSEPITVTAGGTVSLAAEMHVQLTVRSGCHDRKDGTPYDKYGSCPPPR